MENPIRPLKPPEKSGFLLFWEAPLPESVVMHDRDRDRASSPRNYATFALSSSDELRAQPVVALLAMLNGMWPQCIDVTARDGLDYVDAFVVSALTGMQCPADTDCASAQLIDPHCFRSASGQPRGTRVEHPHCAVRNLHQVAPSASLAPDNHSLDIQGPTDQRRSTSLCLLPRNSPSPPLPVMPLEWLATELRFVLIVT